MIHIETKGPIGDAFSHWREKAENARMRMLQEWQATGKPPEELDQKTWKELKELFLNDIFHYKCAYCEGNISAHVTLDVEHYRPKKQVTEDRRRIEHDGYYWLAYEWYNLLLACRNCNSAHSDYTSEGARHPGKASEFPIRGNRVSKPSSNHEMWQSELEQEKPLLLNPYSDHPEEHIAFDENGVAYAKKGSERGKATIEICDLNRDALVTARNEQKYKVAIRLADLYVNKPGTVLVDDSDAFSAWTRCHLKERVGQKVASC